jgi:hypothetical protein
LPLIFELRPDRWSLESSGTACAINRFILNKALSKLTKGKPMNQSILTQEPGTAVAPSPVRDKLNRQKASPQAETVLQPDDDSRVWDILGRVEFSADSGDSPAPSWTPLPGSDVEVDDDAVVWDILGRVESMDY